MAADKSHDRHTPALGHAAISDFKNQPTVNHFLFW